MKIYIFSKIELNAFSNEKRNLNRLWYKFENF